MADTGPDARRSYHHGNLRQALVDATLSLIEEKGPQGFELFGRRLEGAFDQGRAGPLATFFATGRAYLDFARASPGFYVAMFESGVSIAGNPELADAADRAMSILVRAAEALAERLPPDRRPPARMVANHIWALSHGVVELFTRGTPGGRAPYSADEMLESGAMIYLRGLGLIPEPSAGGLNPPG